MSLPIASPLSRRLDLTIPLIQAPMAGIATPQLAAAVSRAGALGSLALGTSSVEQAANQIDSLRALTDRPFNVNFFCHQPPAHDPARDSAWLTYLTPHFQTLGATPPANLAPAYETALGNDAMLEMLLDRRPPVVSFHFGLPDTRWVTALHQAGILLIACITTQVEADLAEQAGMDMLVAQGMEAGGHRGCFDPDHDARQSLSVLLGQLRQSCRLPVIAAGGLMDGRDLAAIQMLGAAGAQLGTAFILCPESSADPTYRAALQQAEPGQTDITATISGRPARGLANRMHHLLTADAPPIAAYPNAYTAGKALIQAAAAQGNPAYAAYWAGQGAARARAMPAAALVQCLADEWQQALHEACQS